MTAATPDGFDSPDGRTYSEPVSAATPGQAARLFYLGRRAQELPPDWRNTKASPESAIEIAPGVRVALTGTGDFMLPDGSVGRGAGIAVWAAIAAQQPRPDRSLLALVAAHFVGNGPYPLQLVCWTEDASDVECDMTIAEVEPGTEWDELEKRIAEHAAEHHATAQAGRSLADVPLPEPQPAPELAAAMAALAEYERYAERGTVPSSAARLAIRERAGLEGK